MFCLRDLRYLAYGLAIASLLWAFPAKASFSCSTLKSEMHKMFTTGYGYVGVGSLPNGAAIMMFLDVKTGRFVFVGVDEKDNACELFSGEGWQFILVRDI